MTFPHPNQKLNIEYLKELAKYSMKTNTFGWDWWEQYKTKTTMRQFIEELRAEMEYHYEEDVRQGLVDEKGEDIE